MSIVVNINGTDRKKFIDWKSLKIQNILTSQVDKCNFNLRQNYADQEFIPEAGMEVIITDDAVRVFAGYIVRRDKLSSSYKDIRYKIECVDYTRLLQKKLVAETYESMTVEDIIKAIIDRYASGMGIDYTNVICTKTIEKITFNYTSVQQCIQQLSDIVGFDWWVDYNKKLYFKGVGTVSSPFNLTDTNGKYVFNSLRIRKDNSQIKNSVIVRGGNYFGLNRRDSIEASGVDFIFPLAYKYKDFSASLTGQALSVGIDFSSDPDAYDALYNYNEKRLVFKEADTPSVGSTLSVSGQPLIPVIVKVKDPASINSMLSAEGVSGEYEHIIVDKNLSSKQEARDRASAELIAYKSSLVEGEFETETSGLEAGQQITITSDAYNIDETYLIRQVTRVMMTPTVMRYRVRLISTRTIDMVGLLQKLLLGQTADIEFSSDEIVDLVTSFYETYTLVEDLVTVSKVHNPVSETLTAEETSDLKPLDYPVEFVAGPFTPVDYDAVLGNLTHRWKLDDDDSTVDDPIAGLDGFVSGAVWQEKGLDGYCLDFDTNGDTIDLDGSFTLTGAFSMAVMLKWSGALYYLSLFGNATTFANGRVAIQTSTQQLRFDTVGSSGDTPMAINLTQDKWQCVIITRTAGGVVNMYIDGVSCEISLTRTGDIVVDRLFYKPDNSGYQSWRGPANDIRFYDGYVLTSQEIQDLSDRLKRVFNCDGSRLG
jgi:hypothetical protein